MAVDFGGAEITNAELIHNATGWIIRFQVRQKVFSVPIPSHLRGELLRTIAARWLENGRWQCQCGCHHRYYIARCDACGGARPTRRMA